MASPKLTKSGKPFDIRERLLDFGCDIVRAAQFLHKEGPIGRALSYQILAVGTSVGANAEEADGASSHADFIAKNRIALEEAKETKLRLRICRRCGLLDERFDPLLKESEEVVLILGAIVHKAMRKHSSGLTV